MNTNIISGLINCLAAIFSLLFVFIRVHSWLKFFPGPANGHKPQNPLVPGEINDATSRLGEKWAFSFRRRFSLRRKDAKAAKERPLLWRHLIEGCANKSPLKSIH